MVLIQIVECLIFFPFYNCTTEQTYMVQVLALFKLRGTPHNAHILWIAIAINSDWDHHIKPHQLHFLASKLNSSLGPSINNVKINQRQIIMAMSVYFCMMCNCTICNLLLLGKLHFFESKCSPIYSFFYFSTFLCKDNFCCKE